MGNAISAQEDIIIDVQVKIANARKDLHLLKKDIHKNAAAIKATSTKINEYSVNLGVAKAQMAKLNKQFKQPVFAGYAMSIMFAGMALKNMATGLARWGVSSFQDISHSVEGTVTQAEILTGAFTYLGFTIGQALEPVLQWLVPIIMSVADWVTENQSLTAGIIVASIAIGTMLFVLGSMKLAYDGLVGTITAVKLAMTAWDKASKFVVALPGNLSKIGVAIKGIAASIWSMMVPILGWIFAIGLLVAFFFIMKDSWDNVWAAIKLKLEHMVLRFQYSMKQMEIGWTNFKYVMVLAWEYIKLAFVEVVNFLLRRFADLVNGMRWFINRIIDAMQFLGIQIQNIPEWEAPQIDTAGIKSDINKVQGDWVNAYNAIKKESDKIEFDIIDNINAQKKNSAEAKEEITNNFKKIIDGAKNLLGMGTTEQASSVVEAVEDSTNIVTEGNVTADSESKVINNYVTIEARRDDESDEQYLDRLLKKLQLVV